MKRIATVLSLVFVFAISLMYAEVNSENPESIGEFEEEFEPDMYSAQEAIEALRNIGMVIMEEKIAAPDFALENLNGDVLNLSDYRGKIVMLNFWATWCGPCRIEMPSMESLYKDLASEDFAIIAINAQEEPDLVNKYIEEAGYSFPVVLDPSGKVLYQYGIRALPTTYIIDPDGNVVAGKPGIHIYDGEIHRKIFRSLM